MRCPVFSVIIIIFILGFLANESTPAPPVEVTWSPFNLSPTREIAQRAARIAGILWPSFGELMQDNLLMRQIFRGIIDYMMETFNYADRMASYLTVLDGFVPSTEMQNIFEEIRRLGSWYVSPGQASVHLNEALRNIEGLSGDELLRVSQEIVAECLFMIGYTVTGHEHGRYRGLSRRHVYVILTTWLMHFDTSSPSPPSSRRNVFNNIDNNIDMHSPFPKGRKRVGRLDPDIHARISL